ncbi:MAG TPA: phosphoglycolate phosphatase [Methylotenera sp.]
MAFDVKAVMFDLDGTLVHTAPEIAFALNEMLAALELPQLPQQQIEGYIGEGAQMLIRRCVTAHMQQVPDDALFEQAQALFFAHYADNVTQSKPYEGVVETLAALQDKGLKLACVTNKPEKFTIPLLDKSGLLDFFEVVVCGDTLPKKKPDPIQLRYICAKFNVLEAEAMLVGDSLIDVAAAHAAGCYIVTVPYGYNQGKPIDHSLVDETITSLSELLDLLT